MDSSLLEECSSISDIDVIISNLKQLDKYDIKYYSQPTINIKDNKINSETNLCDRCGKICKDKRGLTLHLKSCEGIVVYT